MASITKGAGAMKRTKRTTILRVALGLAVAAAIIPAGGQAKPTPGPTPWQSVVIPYLSQGHGVTSTELGYGVASSPDDRAISKATSQRVVIPYLSQGYGVTSSQLGFVAKAGPDDRTFSKA